jgi:putative DNA primase/helicase
VPRTITRPAKPPAPKFENIPPELKAQRRWLCWRYSEEPNSSGKYGKIPHNIGDRRANYTDRSVWLPFDTVFKQYSRQEYDGIGVVLGDGLCGLDEDHCWREDWWSYEAAQHIELLRSYTEYSVSRNGVHVFAFGTLPPVGRRRGDHEIYDDRRFLVVTGDKMDCAPAHVEFRERELHDVHAMIFGPEVAQTVPPPIPQCVTQVKTNTHCLLSGAVTEVEPTSQERKEREKKSNSDLSSLEETNNGIYRPDDRVFAMILNDPVAKGYWDGYPAGANGSEIDWAMAMKLAFYSGNNLPQMDRLFRRSGLFGRPKHFSRRGGEDYVAYTLRRACESQRAVWHPKKAARSKLPMGRPLSKNTCEVVALLKEDPSRSSADIARALDLKPSSVRQIRHRHAPKTSSGHPEESA